MQAPSRRRSRARRVAGLPPLCLAAAVDGLCWPGAGRAQLRPKRRQGSITKAGNSAARRMLVEVAWHYQHEARVSPVIAKRQDGLPTTVTDIAWKAQLRLTSKFKRLTARRVMKNKAVVAVARELAGFVWAIGCEVQASGWRGLPASAVAAPVGPAH